MITKAAGNLTSANLGATITIGDGQQSPSQLVRGRLCGVHHVLVEATYIENQMGILIEDEEEHPEVRVDLELLGGQTTVTVPAARDVEFE